MSIVVDRVSYAACRQTGRPPPTPKLSALVPVLAAALGPAWSVTEEVDPDGEGSVVVLPTNLDRTEAFILYDDGIRMTMAVIIDEQWTDVRRFASPEEAVNAVVAHTSRLAPS